MFRLQCPRCLRLIDEADLADRISGFTKIGRLVTLGKCPDCNVELSVTWMLETIDVSISGDHGYVPEEELEL